MKKILLFVLFNLIYSQLSLKLLAEDFDKPVYATSQNKNSDLIYIVEQSGMIWIVDNSIVLDNPFLDIEDRVHQPLFPGDEMGLLGFAFDPDYHHNKYIYLNYVDKYDNTIISRFETNDYIANKTSEQIIIKFKQPYSNHNGGAIALGHPLGVSGTRIIHTAAIELKKQNKKYALVTMCIGVGQGYATIIKRV